jgi:energy-coupling factor transporter transmembrane protein EcfT
MNKVVKIKYKIENKEIIYWIMFFAIVSIYALLSYFVNKQYHIIYLIILELFVPFAFFAYFFINFFRCRKVNMLCNNLKNNRIEISINELLIKIKIKDYRIKPLNQSMDVNIKTSFRTVKAYHVQASDFFILFFQVYDFGLFRHYIRPVVFKKSNAVIPNFMKDIYLIETYEKKEIEDGICIKLNNKVTDIAYLILPVNFEI